MPNRRNRSNELLAAIAVVGTLAVALTFAIILTVSSNADEPTDSDRTRTAVAGAGQVAVVPTATLALSAGPTDRPSPDILSPLPAATEEVPTDTPESPTALPILTTTAAPPDTPAAIPTRQPAASPTVEPSPTARPTVTAAPAPVDTATPRPTRSLPLSTATSPVPSNTPSQAPTVARTPTRTPTPTSPATATLTATHTPRPTATPSRTPPPTATATPTVTRTPSVTPTFTPSATATRTPTPTPTRIVATLTFTPYPTLTPSITPFGGEQTRTPSASGCLVPPDWIVYTIQPGDTLFRLALRFGLGLDELAVANCIANPANITAGQRLYVPPGSNVTPPAVVPVMPDSPPVPDALRRFNCDNPAATILQPQPGTLLRGTVAVFGTATHPDFQFYKLQVSGSGVEDGSFATLMVYETPVFEGELGTLNTAAFAPGDYWLRLTVVDKTGNWLPECTVWVRFMP